MVCCSVSSMGLARCSAFPLDAFWGALEAIVPRNPWRNICCGAPCSHMHAFMAHRSMHIVRTTCTLYVQPVTLKMFRLVFMPLNMYDCCTCSANLLAIWLAINVVGLSFVVLHIMFGCSNRPQTQRPSWSFTIWTTKPIMPASSSVVLMHDGLFTVLARWCAQR